MRYKFPAVRITEHLVAVCFVDEKGATDPVNDGAPVQKVGVG
jgi:hypothetical protein